MFASSSRRLPVFMVKVSRCVERAGMSGRTLSETSCSCGEADMDNRCAFVGSWWVLLSLSPAIRQEASPALTQELPGGVRLAFSWYDWQQEAAMINSPSPRVHSRLCVHGLAALLIPCLQDSPCARIVPVPEEGTESQNHSTLPGLTQLVSGEPGMEGHSHPAPKSRIFLYLTCTEGAHQVLGVRP